MPIRFNQTELYVYNAMHKANDLSTDRPIGRLITIIEYFFVFFLNFKHFLSLSLSRLAKHMRNKFTWNYWLNQAAKQTNWFDRFFLPWEQVKRKR